MKALKRILSIVLGIIVLAIVAGMLFLNNLKTRAVPDYNENVDLDRLSDQVTVFRDSMGVPHIYAQNELDLYRTVGYIMAQDRLWQMDLLRRITLGRLSEVLDPGLVEADLLFRSLRFSEKSQLLISRSDPALLASVDAFCDGINQYIDRHQKKLPFEFAMLGYKPDPWEPVHTFNFVGYMNWTLASGWSEEIALFKLHQLVDSALFAELLPNMDLHETYVYPDYIVSDKSLEIESMIDDAIGIVDQLGLRMFQASNNWAVSGERSETGMPLLSNDMHLGLNSPGIWYQIHQVVEGSFNITGTAFPCSPFIIAGHNEEIAWGWTNLYVDDTDFYLETINPEDTNQYLLDGKWVNMKIVEEEIGIKGEDDPVTRINRFTHRGPVVSQFKGIRDRVISMRWQGNEYSNEYRTAYLLPRAKNWEDFRDAVSTFYVGQNGVYADRSGNIGMQTVAGIPIRKGSGILVYPGDTSLYDWTGQVPFEELPNSFNPGSGHVSSANNRTVGDDYPYYIGTWYTIPHRLNRIREMLDSKEKHGIADFRHMLKDFQSHLARQMTPLYIDALKGETEGIYHSAFNELSQWDHNMDAGSSAALIYEMMWIELHKALFLDELGDDIDILIGGGGLTHNLINRIRVNGGSGWCDDVTTPDMLETFQDNIRSAFVSAVDTIAAMFGDEVETWQWGDLHKLSMKHPMGSVDIVDKLFRVNKGPFPIGGSFHTVCPYAYPMGSSFIVNHTASQRHIYNTADWDKSLTVLPTGISGVPASPHYLDQSEMFVNNMFHRDHFSREAVETNMMYKAVFD